VNLLKVDIEGHEPKLFDSLAGLCAARPNLWPRTVLWEQTNLERSEQARLATIFEAHGYFSAGVTFRRDFYDQLYIRAASEARSRRADPM